MPVFLKVILLNSNNSIATHLINKKKPYSDIKKDSPSKLTTVMISINLLFNTHPMFLNFSQQPKNKASTEISSKKTKRIFKSVLGTLNHHLLPIQTLILTSTNLFLSTLSSKIKLKIWNSKILT